MNNDQYDHDDDEDIEFISKTKRKQECHDIQDMGSAIIGLSQQDLEKMQLPEDLQQAVEDARRMPQRGGALKRQKQFIGKLMRGMDTEEIARQLEQIQHAHDLNNAQFKRMEKWRDDILATGDDAINDFVNEYPMADRQNLRQLYRNAQRERQQNKPPAAARQLFKYIREIVED